MLAYLTRVGSFGIITVKTFKEAREKNSNSREKTNERRQKAD